MVRQPAKWYYLVVVAITLFAAFQFYQWHSVGQLYYHSIGGGTYVSYKEHPDKFTYAAIAYSSALLFFGSGLLYALIGRSRRWRRRRDTETGADDRYVARPLNTRHNHRRAANKNSKGTP